jgi:hypothetical protein
METTYIVDLAREDVNFHAEVSQVFHREVSHL